MRELAFEVPDAEAALVLDGLDRLYDGCAFSVVRALIDAVDPGREGSPWRVVVTCQTQEWPRLQQCLLHAGVPSAKWSVVECEPVSPEALMPVWETIPQAARLRYQLKLRPLLVNLKILDLIASRLATGAEVQTTAWVGESSVANWYWQSQIAIGHERGARERFAMLLAERQADELRLALPLNCFGVPELGPLDGLQTDRVCARTDDGRVVFVHDLFGDWARLRVLIAHADTLVHFLNARLDSPLWHRAIRLYGAYLLEHARDVAQWRSLLSTLSAQRDEGACDLLLESIVFSANPASLLAQVQVDLMREQGLLLRRLLGRFLVFATLPDPSFVDLARADGYETTAVAVHYRCPNWPYWPSVLRFLHEHRADVLQAAAAEIARIVDLWLTHTEPGFPLRREAAQLGLLLGERARAARRTYGGIDHKNRRLYYQVALTGADELPDDVAAFALQASERVADNKDHSEESVIDEQELPKSIILDPRYDHEEPNPEPWPDGPHARVDNDFQAAVLDSGALLPLARCRPVTAREVLLASLIKSRTRFHWSSHRLESRELDLDGDRRWHPPLYIHGPFLGFLKINFDEALESIARLVDFASERWRYYTDLEAHQHEAEAMARGPDRSPLGRRITQWRQPPGTVIVPLENGGRELVGDARVYGWSAGLGNPPSAIEAALMAIEQYFYLELDEKRPISDKVRAVLERARSAALLKPLCDVGKRQTELFVGPLRPLLAVPEVYEWEIQANVQGRLHMLIGAVMHGRRFAQLAKEFHELQHRSIDLRELGMRLFLTNEGLREYLSSMREHWERRLEATPAGPFREILQQLIVGYEFENYRIIDHPEHGRVIVNVRAQEKHAAQTEERQWAEQKSLPISLPMRCRRMLDEKTVLAAAGLDELWKQVQWIERHGAESPDSTVNEPLDSGGATQAFDTDGQGEPTTNGSLIDAIRRALSQLASWLASKFSRSMQAAADEAGPEHSVEGIPTGGGENLEHQVDALAGAAAVLIRLHADWLAEHPERKQWCRDQLRRSVLRPAPRDPLDVPESTADWTWDCFAAEALPALWAERPDEAELRHLIARIVFAPHYVAVRILFQRCAEHRAILGADFQRLRRLVFELAHMRDRVSFVYQAQHYNEAFAKEEARRFGEAVETWAQERVAAFVEGSMPVATADWCEMDQPERFAAVDALRAERSGGYILDFRLLRAAHEWLPPITHALNEGERRQWLDFLRAALRFSLGRVSEEGERDSIPHEDDDWILDRVAGTLPLMHSQEHPEELWRAVFDLGATGHYWSRNFLQSFHRLALQQDPVPSRFSAMRVAIVDYALGGGDRVGWSEYDEAWQALIGVDVFTRSTWEPRHAVLANEGQALLERWVNRAGPYGRHLAALAAWLEVEAGASLRLPGLVWLYRALIAEGSGRVDGRESAEDAIASLLQVVWKKDETRLRGDLEAFAAFRSLLRWLAARQNPLALDLTGAIGGL